MVQANKKGDALFRQIRKRERALTAEVYGNKKKNILKKNFMVRNWSRG